MGAASPAVTSLTLHRAYESEGSSSASGTPQGTFRAHIRALDARATDRRRVGLVVSIDGVRRGRGTPADPRDTSTPGARDAREHRVALVGRVGIGLGVLLNLGPAHAGGPLGPEGSAITTSAYTVDLFQGPLTASNRVTGLAGAVAPLAEGIDMHAFNPASPAVRRLHSWSVTEFDVSAGVTFPGALKGLDFDNDGTKGFRYDNFVFVTLNWNCLPMRFGKHVLNAI